MDKLKRGKLKSRKFWITIVVIAVAILKGLQESGVDGNPIIEGICIACACAAGVAYVFAEALVDKEDETIEILPEDNDEVEAAG